MLDPRAPGPTIALAPWLALVGGPEGGDAVDREARARLAALPLRPYEREATAGDGPEALALTLPGASPSLPPLVLAARSDLHDPAGLAGLAAALAVPALLVDAALERDLVVVVTGAPRGGAGDGRLAPPASALADWFERRRRHDVKAAVVVARLRPARLEGLIHVAGVETDARLPSVLDGAAPAGWHVVLGRHGTDGLPFAAHRTPYLRVGGAPWAAEGRDAGDLAGLERLASHAARLVATLLQRLDGARLPGPYTGYDSTDVELAYLTAALGPRAEDFGGPPRGRDDLDELLARLGF